MMKFVKICLLSIAVLLTFAVGFCGSYLGINYLKYQNIPLQAETFKNSSLSIEIFDKENKQIKEDNQFESCKLGELNSYTPEAFLSIEDKDFYKHKGLNYKRMVGAMLNNIKSMSLKEGASTISQQLIKNTHLNSEKTFKRKLKEVALTKKLEKRFSKDDILESYLNIIFFGNNCYGLESASKYYFNKDAKQLSLNESATLAGMIKSPTKYSPIHNYDNAIKRRNLVLSEMEKDGYIDVNEKIHEQQMPIKLDIKSKTDHLNTYSQSALDEASKILKISPKQIAVGGYKIHTYFDSQKQNDLKKALENAECENCGIVINNQTHGVSAYLGNSVFKLMDCRRQPASCIKPLLVYAPALNEEIITPETQILDEKITIGGYSPLNVNKKYGGYMSVTDAVKNSVNIPAIKVMSYIGLDTGKEYAQKLGITFDDKDDSYALALGGMTYGVNLKDLTTAYTSFANLGNFCDSTFIQYITDSDNKLVYYHKPEEKMVFREDCAYLMTNILQQTAQTGTARKLSDISNTEIASKTGTVGKKNTSGNTDAYNISYTPEETIGVWFGNTKNEPIKVAGGNQPTTAVKNYIEKQTYLTTKFEIPSSIEEAKLDLIELEQNHRLVLANRYTPERYTKTALFSRFNLPTEISQNFAEKPKINANASVENNQIVLNLDAQKHIKYQIYKDEILYQTISDKNEKMTLKMPFSNENCTLKIVATYNFSTNDEISTSIQEFNLKRPQKTTPKKEWYL